MSVAVSVLAMVGINKGGEIIDKGFELLFKSRVGKKILKDLKIKMSVYNGKIPPNHDLEHAIRIAELTSSMVLLEAYRRESDAKSVLENKKNKDWFVPVIKEYLEGQMSTCLGSETVADTEIIRELEFSLNTILSARDEKVVKESLAKAERQVWNELERAAAAAKVSPTEDFARIFSGGSKELPGWSLVFLAFMREALKTEPRAEVAFMSSRVAAMSDALRHIEEILEKIRRALEALHPKEILGPTVPAKLDRQKWPSIIDPVGYPRQPPIKWPHLHPVNAAAFSKCGKFIATATRIVNERGKIFVWNIENPKPSDVPLEIGSHVSGLVYVAFSWDGSRIVSTSEDKTAQIWHSDGSGSISKRTPLTHEGTVHCAAFSADDSKIVTGSLDGTAVLWDAYSGRRIHTLQHRDKSNEDDDECVNSAFFSPTGDTVITGAYYGAAKIWDCATGNLVKSFEGKHRILCCADYSPDGTQIVTSDGGNGTTYVWDVSTGNVVATLGGRSRHKDSVWSAAFSNCGKKIVTASADSWSFIWDIATEKAVVRIEHPAPVTTAYFSADDRQVLTACEDGFAYLWDVA